MADLEEGSPKPKDELVLALVAVFGLDLAAGAGEGGSL